jgi:hypothetical protein
MDPMPFKQTVTCPTCSREVKIQGVISMGVALYARQVKRLGCDDCRKEAQGG